MLSANRGGGDGDTHRKESTKDTKEGNDKNVEMKEKAPTLRDQEILR